MLGARAESALLLPLPVSDGDNHALSAAQVRLLRHELRRNPTTERLAGGWGAPEECRDRLVLATLGDEDCDTLLVRRQLREETLAQESGPLDISAASIRSAIASTRMLVTNAAG